MVWPCFRYGDIESWVDSDKKHHPNLLILQLADEEDSSCKKEVVYKDLSCINQFLEEALKKDGLFAKSTVVFHNGLRVY